MAALPKYTDTQNADPALSAQSAFSRASVWRLRKHADYQRVYKASRKQFSSNMTYFAAVRTPDRPWPAVRVGLTAGRALGGAVERNRIKRRMRAVVRTHLALLPSSIDVILHPRTTVLTISFSDLDAEVRRIFRQIADKLEQSERRLS